MYMPPPVVINYLAVLAATVLSNVLGMLWYGPLFGKVWMKATGKSMADMKKGGSPMMSMSLNAVAILVLAYVLAHFIQYAGAKTPVDGMIAGFWVWLGFVATTSLATYLFEGRNIKLYYIYMGYQLVSLLLMGALLAAWI